MLSGLPSQEGSGLKHMGYDPVTKPESLPSQEGSGLKLYTALAIEFSAGSSLARGKWIEAPGEISKLRGNSSSLARGKWIEAAWGQDPFQMLNVFPRKREVD